MRQKVEISLLKPVGLDFFIENLIDPVYRYQTVITCDWDPYRIDRTILKTLGNYAKQVFLGFAQGVMWHFSTPILATGRR